MGNQEMKAKYEGYYSAFVDTSIEIGSSIGLTKKQITDFSSKNSKLVANTIKGKPLSYMNEYLNHRLKDCISTLETDNEVKSLFQKHMNQ
jgi:hypothetical protein